ncbi:CDC45 [Bugula neritina]|uniref:CDC45 n=1 Tax=Bugula neritina TaxID=10212 RepID=A0A7J7J8Q9_BUGNE|nr:CDC45 [Bugula neritina]
MVFTKDFVRDFYKVIQKDRVLVLVNHDVDAICAAKIIQCLFTWDNVVHSIVPVDGKEEIEAAFMEHVEGVKYVLFLNCGGCLDLVDILQPDPEIVFFILDSHRPISVENIYNAVQTRIVLRQEEVDQDIPDYEDVFRDDESESEGDDSDIDEDGRKRQRFDAKYLEKRQERRAWNDNRIEVLSKYMSTCHTGASSALTMYSIAFTMSEDTVEMLWWAIIGVTSQFIFTRVDHDHYFDNVVALQDHVSRVSKRYDDIDVEYSMSSLRLSFENDIVADLYRHWNLYDSLGHSLYTATQFKIWSLKGKSRFHEFLAVMGLPLTQCKQKFSSMEPALRNNLKSLIGDHSDKFNLDQNNIFIPTFVASMGYRSKISAVDYALVCAAMLENCCEIDTMEKFHRARMGDQAVFDRGVSQAIKIQSIIMSQVQFLLSTNAITPAHYFLYAIISEGSPESIYFRSPILLERLAHFTLEAFIASDKCSAKRKELPLILICPLSLKSGKSIVVGIPPIDTIKSDNCRNIFGEVFKQVRQNIQCRTNHNSFDSHGKS